MQEQLAQLERLVEQEAELLGNLSTPAPRPEVVDRVRQAVRAEAARLGGSRRTWMVTPRWVGAAAAVVLALGLQGVFSGSRTPDAGELFDVWAEAVDDSSEQFTLLLDDDWMLAGDDGETGAQVEGLLDSLDSAFEQLSSLDRLGAS